MWSKYQSVYIMALYVMSTITPTGWKDLVETLFRVVTGWRSRGWPSYYN